MRRYSIVLLPEPEEGGYTVLVPALPCCHTQGETVKETLANAREVIELFVADLEAHGEPVPVETERPRVATVEIGHVAA
ncbi:MAG: type II toxin-antitoxin system HicB family antitoxin [Chloroflexota bacterium]